MDKIKKALSRKKYGTRITDSASDNVGTWKGDPTVAPPVRRPPPPTFTVPPPPSAPPSNPTSVTSSASPTPPRAESPPKKTKLEELRNRKNAVPTGVVTATSSQVKPGWYGVQPAHGLGRTRKRKTRKHKRNTHRRRR